MTGKYEIPVPSKNAFDTFADATDQVKKRTKNILRGSINAVCLIAIISLEILHRFVQYGFNPDFAWDYVFSAVISSMTTLLAFYVFYPNGKNGRRMQQSWQDAYKALDKARKALSANGAVSAFRQYCRSLTSKREAETMKDRFDALENRYVTRQEYEERYRFMSKRKLKKLVKNGEIDRAAMRQILYCQKRIKSPKYSPSYFLADVKAEKESVYLHGKDHYEARTLAMRPLLCVGTAVFASLLTWAPKVQTNALDVFLSIAISIFQICMASFMGYSSGTVAADHEELAMRAKAGFIEEYNEKGNTAQ